MESKKYYWLKLRDDFFTSKRIKKLRNMAGGDTYVIIYLKMQLMAMKSDGVIRWTGLEDKFADELALDLDEKPADVEVTLMYLLHTGLVETSDNITFFLPYAVENTGKESSSAERVRAFRAREKEKGLALQCNTDVTACNTEIEKELEKEKDTEKEDKESTDIGEEQKAKFITLVLADGTNHVISEEYTAKMQACFPDVNIRKELLKMSAWCINNPSKRKTKRGITRFINSWLSTEQDKAEKQKTASSLETNNIFLQIAEERNGQH